MQGWSISFLQEAVAPNAPCAIGDVGLAVAPSAAAVRVKHREGVEEGVVGALKVADGQRDLDVGRAF